MDDKAYLKDLVDWEYINGYKTRDLVCEWSNCVTASVDADGAMWIKRDASDEGHWLTDDELAKFVAWAIAR